MSWARLIFFSCSRASAGTSSRRTHSGLIAALLHQCRSHLCHVSATSFLDGLGLVAGSCGRGLGDLACERWRLADHLDVGTCFAPGALAAAHPAAPAAASTPPLAAALAATLAGLVAILGPRLALGLLLLASAVRRVARLALDGGVRNLRAEEPDRADGVVVARDDEVDAFRIAIRVDEADDGNPETRRLVDCDVLLLGIDDEETAGKAGHLLDAAEVLLQLVHLVLEDGDFLLRQFLEGAVAGHLLERLQAVDAALDGLEFRDRG